MSPEARATVLGDKTGAIAFDALLMKGAGGATKGLATEVKGILKETAEETSRRLSQSGSSVALTTPEGVRITVKNSPSTEIQKIDFGKVEGTGDVKKGDSSPIAPGGGLAAHEARGGHLIERHVPDENIGLNDD